MFFCSSHAYLRHFSVFCSQKETFNHSTMAQTSMTVRLDNQQKAMFDQLCEQFGMSANTAINIFVRTVIRCRRIPFVIAAEPEEDIRAKAINAFREIRKEAEMRTEPEITLEEINAEINAVREAKTEKIIARAII